MRFIFVKELIKKARENKNIYLITSDLGYRAFEEFKKEFPKRFINVGVAENNMIGVATGLALTGKKVFVYSILPFLIFRSLDKLCAVAPPIGFFLPFFFLEGLPTCVP